MDLLAPDAIRTASIFLHLIGLSLGVGGALMLDALIFKYFYCDKITSEKLAVFSFMTRVVSIGLFLLWASGLAFLAIYYVTDPELLTNQKIWGKVFIVTMLTINGVMLHRKIFPILSRNVGKQLFTDITVDEKAMMFGFASVSFVSWIFPVYLGVSKSLNFNTGIENILAMYMLFLSWTCLATYLVYKTVVSRILLTPKR
ncbi:hypothetical protein [Allohahella sp. A8]|uniref:hypothetical protein n=1 Tax=Allohahella sp. A8 TaxID=3141461 RepID=UPI003A800965